VANPGRRDVTLVSDAAADRLGVPRVVVGAEDAVLRIARLHAALQLLQAAAVDLAESLDPHRSIVASGAPVQHWRPVRGPRRPRTRSGLGVTGSEGEQG